MTLNCLNEKKSFFLNKVDFFSDELQHRFLKLRKILQNIFFNYLVCFTE